MIISREDMVAHINAGRAQRWTHVLTPDRMVLVVALLDGKWYAVLRGSDDYQEAPDPIVAVLTAWQAALDTADVKIATADAAAANTAT